MFLGRKAALILATVWLTTNILIIQANFVTDYLAHSAYQKQDFVTAECYYQTQMRSDYTDSVALYNLGAAAYQNKNYIEARKCFEQVGATEALTTKKRAEAYFNAGNSSVQLNELEKALEQYKTALKFDPNDQRIKNNYEKLKKILEQQKQNNPEKNKPEDQDSQDQKSKDNSGDSKDSQDQQKNSGSDQKSKDQAAKDNSGQDQDSKDQAPKDQSGDQQDSQNNQAPKNNPDQKSGDQKPKDSTGSEQKNSTGQKPTLADNSGEQKNSSGPANNSSEQKDSSGLDKQAKLDPELKELMQAAQASDRAVNKQIMQYRMNQSGGQNSADQGNNW